MSFSRKASHLVEKESWVLNEKTYLELFLERVELVVSNNSPVTFSDNEKILEAFNEDSDSRSDLQDTKGQELPTR